MTEVVQYELWRECNCKCTFCTLGNDNEFTPNELKMKSLQTSIDEIKQMTKGEHETLGFIGGEFFQGQLSTKELKDKFFELFEVVNDTLNKGIVNNVWLNVSLLIGNQEDFYKILDMIDRKDRVWVLTSYDTMGRFHTPKMFETWERHLKKIYEEYPEVSINITSILTGDLIEKYLNNEIDLYKYTKLYNASVYFKNPVQPYYSTYMSNEDFNKVLGNFFPKRKDMLKFFMKYLQDYGEYEYDRLISTDLRADEVRKNYNNESERNIKFIRDRETLVEYQENLPDELLPCGHNDIYMSYSDSDKCILCDKQMIKQSNRGI